MAFKETLQYVDGYKNMITLIGITEFNQIWQRHQNKKYWNLELKLNYEKNKKHNWKGKLMLQIKK